jgi:two-component system, cell cycle sensor histidine kinase DivJ
VGLSAAIRRLLDGLSRARVAPQAAEADCYRQLAGEMTGVVTHHARGGTVLFVSSGAELVFGVKPDDLRGGGLFDRVHVADRPAYLKAIGDAAAHNESCSAEFRARQGVIEPGSPARFIWLEMRCLPIGHAGGREAEVVALMRDVTRRKAQEQAVEEARIEAERANLAKSRFLATMSHELRTPLNAIIGFSEMLREEGSIELDAKRRRDYAQLINESGRHLLSVVNGILDMSKIETGNFGITPEPVAAARVIAECCALMTLRAREAGIEVLARLPADLPEIVADKRALQQIMLNLLSNAIKFTDRGGKVTVAAKLEGGELVIAVEDTGVGIASEDLPRIGDPFFQARSSYDRRHDGTGLGVSIVKGLVALHGGAVRVASRVGEGTSVAVRLPLDCTSACARRETKPVALAARANEPATDLTDIPARKRA